MDELRVKKSLEDILLAINEIDVFFEGRNKEFDDFVSDICLRRAVERNLSIMGEAVNRILKEDETICITNARRIVDARNYIVHGYDSLSPDIMWSIVINHLPKLKDEVVMLLSK